MVVCQPVEIGFETDDSPVELIVGTDLAAAREYGLLGIAPTIAKAVTHVALGPGRASIAADIEAGPVEDRHNACCSWRPCEQFADLCRCNMPPPSSLWRLRKVVALRNTPSALGSLKR